MTSPSTTDDFARALPVILRFEGGRVDDPDDPGGRTAFGVTQREFDASCRAWGIAPRDVFTILPNEVATIYRVRFWKALKCDTLGWPMCLLVFDAGVNHGLYRAREFLKLAKTPGEYLDCRLAFYHRLVARRPASKKYLKGWTNRVNALRKIVEAG